MIIPPAHRSGFAVVNGLQKPHRERTLSPAERDEFRFLVLLRLHAVGGGGEGDNSLALDEIAHGVAPSEVRAAVVWLIELGYASWTTSGVRVLITPDGQLLIEGYISLAALDRCVRHSQSIRTGVDPVGGERCDGLGW